MKLGYILLFASRNACGFETEKRNIFLCLSEEL